MNKKQVFISYKSEEFDEALWVKNTLEAQGITCWMAPMCITGGASYAAEIPAAINNCTVFVLILSEKVQRSKWVPRELDQAINAGKTIMPFMLEDCPLIDEFKFYLSNIQRYYAYQDKLGTMDIMSRQIRAILGIPDPVIPEPPKPEPPKSEPPKRQPQPVSKKPPKKKKRALPFILGGVAAAILLPVLLISLLIAGSKVTFAGTVFKKNAYTVQVENQTVTAEDLQALSKFKDLNRVCLKDCTLQVEDLSAFSSHSLWELALEGCSLTNSQLQSIGFEALEQLTALDLNGNPELTDLSAIAPVGDTLTELSIGDTGVNDLEAIEGFTKLTKLSVENLGLGSLEALNLTVYLETLIADGNALVDLSGLENITVLKTVSLKDNQLQQVDHLKNSAGSLQRLCLDGNGLQDLSCLATCTNIIEFSADRNRLTSMDFTQNWTKLMRLSLADNEIQDGTLLPPQSQALLYLDLSGNKLTKFSDFLLDSSTYVTVDLSGNAITSVTLPENCKYNILALHGNPLTDLSFAEGIDGYHLSVDYFDALESQTVQSIEFNNLYIIDCPPNRIVELEQASYNVKLLSSEEADTQLPNPEFPEY